MPFRGRGGARGGRIYFPVAGYRTSSLVDINNATATNGQQQSTFRGRRGTRGGRGTVRGNFGFVMIVGCTIIFIFLFL